MAQDMKVRNGSVKRERDDGGEVREGGKKQKREIIELD